ncbi:transcriptional regulator [Streptomyces chartreusis]|uniref:transcriptional regulator n=1 Tax=Streptomyces chartreusis TaxID=1969 RepID=UPI0036B6886F
MNHTAAAVFAAAFTALYVAHSVGDHWVQSSCQAADKGLPGRKGRLACTRHVVSLTLTKGIVLALVVVLLQLPVTALGLVLGLGIDAGTHWWADRRTTLRRLAHKCNKTEFYNLGAAGPHAPVAHSGKPAAHLGTGAYALDQAFHHFWLLIGALLIATV